MYDIEDIRSLIPNIIGDTSFYLENKNDLFSIVNHKSSVGQATDTVAFPTIQRYTSSDVYELDIGADAETDSDPTIGAVDAKITKENVIKCIIPKMTTLTKKDLIDNIVNLFIDAELSKVEKDIVEKFSSFSNTVGGAGTTMTAQHFSTAKNLIKMKRYGLITVLSGKQFHGPKGLFGFVDTANFEGTLMKDFIKGYVGSAYGTNIMVSDEINEDVGGLGDAGGAIMTPKAIGLHTKNVADIEMDVKVSQRCFEIVCTGRFKTVMVNTNQGVYFLTDVAT